MKRATLLMCILWPALCPWASALRSSFHSVNILIRETQISDRVVFFTTFRKFTLSANYLGNYIETRQITSNLAIAHINVQHSSTRGKSKRSGDNSSIFVWNDPDTNMKIGIYALWTLCYSKKPLATFIFKMAAIFSKWRLPVLSFSRILRKL